MEIDKAKVERILKYRLSFFDFCKECMGFKDMNDIHKELCNFLQYGKNKFKLILMPRYSFKSTISTVAYSLWTLSNNNNTRVLIYSDASNKATGFLTSIKSHIEGKIALSTFREHFGAWESDSRERKWNDSQIEISVRKTSFPEPSVDTGGIETSKVGFHYDIIIFDDIVSDKNITTKDQMDKVVECYRKALSLLKPGGLVLIVGCLISGSKVTMADGSYKSIEEVKVGEKVFSYKYDRESSIETVEAMIPQGTAKVYELKTRNHTIQATKNHPFMTKDGWKKLEELKVGSQIYSLSYLPRIKKTDFSEDELWCLGFMFGDGWITEHPNSKGSMRWVTCVAKDVYGHSEKAVKILTEKTGCNFKLTKYGYYRAEHSGLAKYLKRLGFKGNAKTKRIPEYIYSLSVKHKESFLNGFLAADGWEDKSRNTELSNFNLVRDLKHLAETCGYKVSNIHSRQRISQPPHSPEPIVSESHHISIGRQKRLKRFRLERIQSIEYIGEKEVFDLTVSNTHNFIAEGFVVHNTRWHFGDLYGRIIAENETKQSFGIFVKNAEKDEKYGDYPFANIGLTQEFLNFQKLEQGSTLYSCIYNNNPVSDETAVFKMTNFSFYGAIKPDDLYITVTCDPAGEGEDFTGMTTVGTDSNMNMHILDVVNEHLQPSEIVERIIQLQYKYRFGILGIETNFFRGMLEPEIKRRRDEEYRNNPSNFTLFGVHEFEASSKKGAGKHSRIMSLQPFHERGAIRFPGEKFELLDKSFSTLAWQMVQYTHDGAKSPHDDAIDSLAYHIPLIRKGGVVKKADVPRFSPAWLEKQSYEKELAYNATLPKRLRRSPESLAFS